MHIIERCPLFKPPSLYFVWVHNLCCVALPALVDAGLVYPSIPLQCGAIDTCKTSSQLTKLKCKCSFRENFPSLCSVITKSNGELQVFEFNLEEEDKCSVADFLWNNL